MNQPWRSLVTSFSQKLLLCHLVLVWITTFIFIKWSTNESSYTSPDILYAPPLVQIPDSIYSLSQSILAGDKVLKTLPTIPTRSNDSNLFVLSVSASRLRSSGSATFIVLKQNDMLDTDLWCLFDDGYITPAYTLNVRRFKKNIFLLECSLNDYSIRRLWYQRTVDRITNIFLASSTKFILQGSLDVPWSNWAEENEQALTLCTLSLDKESFHLIQWIEFHRLVGVSKFVIYNTLSSIDHLKSIVESYDEDFPGLIDIVQWNVSSRHSKHFYAETRYDCLLRYGDVSEWIGSFNINEYLVPPFGYETLTRFLSEHHSRRLGESVALHNYHFCRNNYRRIPDNKMMIDRFIFRCSISSNRRAKYLYRPRALDYSSLDINQQYSQQKAIILARYPLMKQFRMFHICSWDNYIRDTSIRDRFAERLRNRIDNQNVL